MTVTVYSGGPIVTMDANNPHADCIAIDGNRIVYVGALQGALQQLADDCRRVDLKGRCLLPGFIDAHSHLLWAAKTRGAPVVDIRAQTVPTYAAVLAKIKRRVAAAQTGEMLLFFGLDKQLHPDFENPTRAQLDQIAPDNAIGIQTSNCHALYMNSAALQACNIDKNTPTPTGSIIERDERGCPTGMIAEAITWSSLETFYSAWGDERLSDELKASIHEFISNGITTTTEHLYMPFYKSYYLSALKQGLAMPRIAAYQQATTADMEVEAFNLDDRLWMAGVKIHADGSPFIGNIWLSQPYLETPMTLERMDLKPGHTGAPNYPEAYFEKMLRTYVAQGWQMTIHTQGDRTIDMVLDMLDTILAETPSPDHRFRLEHCALMRPEQLLRAQQLGVLCSFFINHITHWGAPIEDCLFGPERAAHYMPAGSAEKAGMRLSLHADTPMTDPSALALMQAATTRIASDGRCVGPEQRLDAFSALKAVTIDAAHQIRAEQKLGSLEVGKLADFVILDQNPLKVAVDQLAQIKVMATVLDGEEVYSV